MVYVSRSRPKVIYMTNFKLWLLASSTLCLSSNFALAQDAKQIVQQAVQTELNANRNDHSQWLYYEEDRKPKDVLIQWVAQTSIGDLRRVLQQNSQKLSPDEQKKQVDKKEDEEKADTFSILELAKFLRCSKVSIHNYKKLGMPFYRIGRKILFKKNEVLNFMKGLKNRRVIQA